MNTIYVYTTETYRDFRGWRKVGQTHQESAEVRVAQQDGTSNPEPLIIEDYFPVPDWISDHTIHAELRKMGKMEVRMDKSREWYACTVDDVKCAINNILHGVSRPNNYAMRPEQQECHDLAVNHFVNCTDETPKFLMNAKMRFGKTFTTYQIIKSLNAKKVLVLTYKPAVDASWREDLETHVDFDGWNYHSSKDHSKTNPLKIVGGGVDIIFGSFQDANEIEKEKWKFAKDYDYDLLVIDEEHFGSKTERARKTLEQLNFDKILFVSGTPLKSLMSGEFLDEEIYTWGYADEQSKRKIEKDHNWKTEIYRWLPEMHVHMFEVSEEAKKMTACYAEEEGFTMTKMFSSDDGEKFKDESAVVLFLDQMFGVGVHKNKSPIRTHAVDHQLWVMPSNVKSVTALCNLVQNKYKDYKVINVAGDNVRDLNKVLDLIERNDKTITVTCGRFNTGVTVKKWDMIVMLDDGRSPETYFQTVFRGGSPDSSRLKEKFTVVDFNPQRCLEMVYEFADITAKPGQSTQESVREFLDFAPVMDHSDNKPTLVDTNKVLNMMAETGGYAERFGSDNMFNWSRFDEVEDKFFGIDPDMRFTSKDQLNDNGLDGGKNYEGNSNGQKTQSEIDQELKEYKERKLRAKTAMRRLPTYLFLEDNKVDTIDDIVYYNNVNLFQDTVGLDIKDFQELCLGFIRKERLNRCIMAYNQIESM